MYPPHTHTHTHSCITHLFIQLSIHSFKEIKTVNLRGNQPWILIGRTNAEAEAPVFWSSDANNWTHWKRPWCWERLRTEGEEGTRGWDGWMASLIQWTWNWANFRRWWGTERPDVLPSMGSQRVVHNWELNHSNTCTFNHLSTYPPIHPSIHLSCTVKVYFLLNLHRIRLNHSFCSTCPWPLESPISLQI